MLLEKGAALNAQGGKFGNVLQAAVISYQYDETVVEMLLEEGANSNAEGGDLSSASRRSQSWPRIDIPDALEQLQGS